MWAFNRQASRIGFAQPASWRSLATASTSSGSNPYPYPTHENPSPYQIFHLSHNASQAEVKRRYIDLVRIYHPDSPVSRALPRELTDGRFQSITKAYDALRGKTPLTPGGFQNKPEPQNPKSAAWKARQARRLDLDTGGDDRWKDKIILFGVVFTIAAFIAQTMATRRQALAEMKERQSLSDQPETRLGSKRLLKKDDRELAAPNSDS